MIIIHLSGDIVSDATLQVFIVFSRGYDFYIFFAHGFRSMSLQETHCLSLTIILKYPKVIYNLKLHQPVTNLYPLKWIVNNIIT